MSKKTRLTTLNNTISKDPKPPKTRILIGTEERKQWLKRRKSEQKMIRSRKTLIFWAFLIRLSSITRVSKLIQLWTTRELRRKLSTSQAKMNRSRSRIPELIQLLQILRDQEARSTETDTRNSVGTYPYTMERKLTKCEASPRLKQF